MKSTMTYDEALRALRALIPAGDIRLTVGTWFHVRDPNPDEPAWQVWLADRREHVEAANPELLVERVVARLASTAPTEPMTAADVRIEDTIPAAANEMPCGEHALPNGGA